MAIQGAIVMLHSRLNCFISPSTQPQPHNPHPTPPQPQPHNPHPTPTPTPLPPHPTPPPPMDEMAAIFAEDIFKCIFMNERF